MENHVFSKPYFDPAGLIIARDNNEYLGFVHAGFGPNPPGTDLARNDGIICVIGVRPVYRRRGIGSELLRRAEDYLAQTGARTFYAGPMAPLTPFYFGLYGGSNMAGFLVSDAEMEPFLRRHGYQSIRSVNVFQCFLNQPLNVADPRFPYHRRRFEVRVVPRTGAGTWWDECVVGPIEIVDFRLEERGTGDVVAWTSVWEMDGFSWRWNQPAVGIVDVEVRADMRRQGFAKFLLGQMLRYLHEQFFGVVEIHAPAENDPASKLYESVGFRKVDTGYLYRKQ
jgi:ribosomal protein S18 acetylase RimI-like enzyme